MKIVFQKLKVIGSQWLPITFLLLVNQANAQLKLPFFDDFSTAKSYFPDTTLWIRGGGVYINNSLAETQQTVNFATFDGRRNDGIPYNFDNKLAAGSSDSLTSKAINLSIYTLKDSVTLSFLWLAKGLGELPDQDDSLRIEFLDKNSNWKLVDSIKVDARSKIPISKDFINRLVKIPNETFLHAAFQFRFVSVGRQSGPFDNWHLDYIKLATKKDLKGNDLAVKNTLKRLFKNYTAMPMRQYLVSPEKELVESMQVDIINIASTGRNISGEISFKIVDSTQKILQETSFIPADLFSPNETIRQEVKLKPLELSGKKSILKYGFSFNASDDTLSGINYTANNSIESTAVLDDYFAYDDGTAEYAAEVEKRFGRVAVQFKLRKEDFISGVYMNFTPFFKNIENEAFLLQVMDSKAGKPDKVIHQQGVKVKYAKDINGLVKFDFTTPVKVNDVFYLAWTKISDEVVPVGMDKNTTDFSDKIFYSTGSEWIQNTELKGAFLVRPIVVQEGFIPAKEIITANEAQPQFIVMPNPTTGLITWNDERMQRAEIYTISGRLLESKTFNKNENQELNLQHYMDGQYLIRFYKLNNEIVLKRIIVLH